MRYIYRMSKEINNALNILYIRLPVICADLTLNILYNIGTDELILLNRFKVETYYNKRNNINKVKLQSIKPEKLIVVNYSQVKSPQKIVLKTK